MDECERRLALIRLRAAIRFTELNDRPMPQLLLVDEELEESEPLDLVDLLDLQGV